ncbi:hypothetical protein VCSRO184_0220 [Vibrio cholerae]|nr:hypothetical protein VCSRO184_0220 [Vibrio cholerae]
MKAGFKDFFGTNLEQEVMDAVVILPFAIRNAATGSIVTPTGTLLSDFEEIRVSLGVNANAKIYASDVINKRLLDGSVNVQDIEWSDPLNANGYSLLLSKHSDTELRWQTASNVNGATCWPLEVIGYKRRISRVGIDELMSAMSLPNLISNADLTDNPINQRSFDGNWAALAVGAYGYDQWMKVSSTHMGAVIEAGKYRPSTKHTFTKDDVVIGEFMSPASGHWTVAVPFATSGKFDLYAGQFKRPWHPVLDGEKRCREHYQTDTVRQSGSSYASGYVQFASSSFAELMRKIPDVTYTDLTLSPATGWTEMTSRIYATRTNVSRIVRNTTLGGASSYIISDIVADASIPLAELNGQIITV